MIYLKELEEQLDTLTNDIVLKSKICQILSELGSLVYPNTGACYSLIPKDLQKINWEKIYDNVNSKHFCEKTHEPIVNILIPFKTVDCHRTLSCLVAQTLCELLAFSQNTNKGLLLNENKKALSHDETLRPRVKASTWLTRLK
jgi:hypothetical protein